MVVLIVSLHLLMLNDFDRDLVLLRGVLDLLIGDLVIFLIDRDTDLVRERGDRE